MNIKNCKKCGKIYNYVVGQNICPACRDEQEARFQFVKNYIGENKGASIPEISEACEVDKGQIQQWIREERLFFSDDSPISIGCELCGTMIKTGRFCQKCKNEMASNLTNSIKPAVQENAFAKAKASDEKAAPKMRFLDR